MKVKIIQRSVYHKIAEVEIELPKEITDIKINKCYNTYGEFDIQQYLIDNENLYVDKIDEKISKAEYEFGFGLGDGMDEMDQESEWRYECEQLEIGGHL
tara:strand:+ start:230 stop:526 length:297 start_codon:yes stop_codon:yes gene_type:complete